MGEMTLKDFFQKGKSVVTMYRDGNISGAWALTMELALAIGMAVFAQGFAAASPEVCYSYANYDAMTLDQLIDKLDELCQDPPEGRMATPLEGPVLDIMKPLLLALLKKLLLGL